MFENKQDETIITSIKQEYKILAEYKMIESEKIPGVYVRPSYENSLLWFGVIFIRSGFFKNGIFRFNISLPDEFPEAKNTPTVIFQNDIFHPLICPYTGTLNISAAFPCWRFGEDHIWQLLKYLFYIFQEPLEYSKMMENPQNQSALDLLDSNKEEFKIKAMDCVQTSINHIYDAAPVDDLHYIKFERFDDNVHGSTLRKMKREGAKLVNSSPQTITGLSWVKEGEFKPFTKEL